MECTEDKERIVKDDQEERGMFRVDEITVEEMAIDGICGVY